MCGHMVVDIIPLLSCSCPCDVLVDVSTFDSDTGFMSSFIYESG